MSGNKKDMLTPIFLALLSRFHSKENVDREFQGANCGLNISYVRGKVRAREMVLKNKPSDALLLESVDPTQKGVMKRIIDGVRYQMIRRLEKLKCKGSRSVRQNSL